MAGGARGGTKRRGTTRATSPSVSPPPHAFAGVELEIDRDRDEDEDAAAAATRVKSARRRAGSEERATSGGGDDAPTSSTRGGGGGGGGGGGDDDDDERRGYSSSASPTSPTRERKKDYYDILGVDFEASDSEIRSAYLKLALRSHPDKQHGDTAEAAKAKFQQIGEAYHVLSDVDRRLAYNESGEFEIDDFGVEEYLKRFHRFVLTSQGLSLASTSADVDEDVQDELRAFLGFGS